MDPSILRRAAWDLINDYFSSSNGQTLVKHLLDSFDDFVLRKLDQIIDGFNPIEIHNTYLPARMQHRHVVILELRNPVLSKPMIYEKDGSTKIMTPNDARQRNFTYAAPLHVDLHVVCKTLNEDNGEYIADARRFQNVLLGKVPIMVRSTYCILQHAMVPDECPYDYGGYFIVNGNEKVVISQDRMAENVPYVFLNNKPGPYSHVAEVRSVGDSRFGVPKTTSLKLTAKPNQFGRFVRASIHHVKHDVPVFILFKALGVEADLEIIKFITPDMDPRVMQDVVGCVHDGSSVRTQREAVEYLARFINMSGHPRELSGCHAYRTSVLLNVLQKEFLPHVGPNFRKKAVYLGYMLAKLLRCSAGQRPVDDRDSYINKRIDTPGVLMASLFRQYYGKVVKDIKNMVHKEVNSGAWRHTGRLANFIGRANIAKIVKSSIIEGGLKYGLATGNWGIKSNKTKQGVAQVLNRMTYNAMLSHLRRINTPIEKSGKLVQPRKLHSTQWGIVCPAETPEGASVGLVKNLAIMASVTLASHSGPVREVIAEHPATRIFDGAPGMFAEASTRVIVNGDIVGITVDPRALHAHLRALKREGSIHPYTGVVWDPVALEISVCTEAGRCTRPLFIVDADGAVPLPPTSGKLAWRNVVGSDDPPFIEFLDALESSYSMIAMTPDGLRSDARKYTHLEMDPSAALGVLAGSIPFSDHNQAPRNTYQSAMGKQAIGVYASNFRKRYDTMCHVLCYPQKPLVTTRISDIVNVNRMPCGINAVVAIATYTGFNQEDSIIVNASALQRGLFTSTYFRTIREINNKNHSTGEEEYFCRPDPFTTKQLKPNNFGKLGNDGFVPENTYVQSGDVIVGKCMPQKIGGIINNKDTSVVLKSNECGFVDRNACGNRYFVNVNGDGYSFAKVRVRNDRVPTIGDKFCVPGHVQALTDRGWVRMDELTTADRVLQRNEDGTVGYVAPLEVMRFAHDGPMFDASGDGVRLSCTLEHRLFVTVDGTDAGVLVPAERFVDWRPSSSAFVKATVRGAVGDATRGAWIAAGLTEDDFAYAVAAFLSRGYAEPGSAIVFLHEDGPDPRLRRIFGIPDQGPELETRVQMREGVAATFFVFGSNPGAASRCLADLGREASETFVVRAMRSGNVVSPFLADVVQGVAVQAGMACDVDFGAPSPRMATVRLRKGLTAADFACDLGGTYHGYVYCVRVPSQVFYVRQDGRGMFTGNSSRHGQKGTVGMVYRHEDMPFSSDGTAPDLIINPHAIPSRMTIAQLMECIMGKACVELGGQGDATPFSGCTVDDLRKRLAAAGFERHGNQVLYNGRTGDQIPVDIFMGPTYYQRLKHMTTDKVHCLDAATEVLTHRGWVAAPDVTLEDRVATLQDGGRRLEYTRPTKCLRFDFRGKMYSVENRDVDLRVTIDHRMYVADPRDSEAPGRFKLVPCSQVVGCPVAYRRDALEWSSWPETGHDPALLVLFGIWMARGAVVAGQFALIPCDALVRDVVVEAAESSGLAWSWDGNGCCASFAMESAFPTRASDPGRLPDWAWNLDRAGAQTLVRALLIGGGRGMRFRTKASTLADDVQRLCLHAGFSAIVTAVGRKRWEARVFGHRAGVFAGGGFEMVCRNRDETVYCLQVPGEVFYVRRNGKPVWTGNSRAANGPVVLLTRQPAEGRARDGGLRLGEMEGDCLLAHGVQCFLKERFMECSDNFRVFVCAKCGMMATGNPERNLFSCRPCRNTTAFSEVRIPYAFKLLLQEIQTMGIGAKLGIASS